MKSIKRAIALGISAALAAGLLAGCGGAPAPGSPGSTPGAGGEASGAVWRAERRKIEGFEGSISAKAVSEGRLYYTADRGYTDDGKSLPNELWSVPMEGGKAERLAQYQPMPVPEGVEDARVQINALSPSGAGLWLYESLSGTRYELPEGYSGGEDGKYEYAKEESRSVLRLLDAATGAEKLSVELDKALEEVRKAAPDNGDAPYFSAMYADAEGNVCVLYDMNTAALFSSGGEFLRAKTVEGWWDSVTRLADGRAALGGHSGEGYALRPVDFKSGDFGADLSLPSNVNRVFTGAGAYAAGYADNLYVYGYDDKSGRSVRLAGMLDCGIDENQISAVYFGEEGAVYCLVNNYDADRTELLRLTELAPEEAAKIVTLRLACNYMSPSLNKAVLDYNSTSTGSRIEVTDYSQYNTDEDYTAGVTKLNTEIISGNVPDLFVTSDLPTARYAAKGLLLDLYGFIDKDPELGRDSFMPAVLKAMETDGKLYSISPGFSVVTLVGKGDVVGREPGWTLAQMQETIKAHPEAKYILGQGVTRSSVLDGMLKFGLERYVNWQTGECSFNSRDFIDVLEFTRLFPEEFSYDELGTSPYEMLYDGRQLLMPYELSDFTDYQVCIASTNGQAAFKGYPTAEGTGNALRYSRDPIAISSTCKAPDEAWKFLSGLLNGYVGGRFIEGLPLLVKAYDAAEAEAMERDTYKDEETGEEKEWPRGSAGWGDFSIDFYAMTKEEAQALRELINSTERSTAYDKNVMDIIAEELQPFFTGAKSAEETARLIQDRVSIYVNEQR